MSGQTIVHLPDTELIYDWNKAGGAVFPSRGTVELDDETLARFVTNREEDIRYSAGEEVARRRGERVEPEPVRQGSLL